MLINLAVSDIYQYSMNLEAGCQLKQEAGLLGYLSDIMSIHVEL